MVQTDQFYTAPNANTGDADAFAFNFNKLLAGHYFIEPVKVVEISGSAPNIVLDVLPLVMQQDPAGNSIANSTLYNIPLWRLQRGNSAIIMDPVVGDIGLIAICDRDTSLVRENLAEAPPVEKRKHSKSDAVYLGGLWNQAPTQYIEFADNAINVISPNPVNINCTSVSVTAPDGMTFNTPTLKVTGDIIDNSSSQSSTVKQLRVAYNGHSHPVSGVETGGSTVQSSATGDTV
ncbi:MAG: hypothetical protein [Caudoviricetes sp.]|nr:MAG: hypothetical protein [Caudoviricetes sp.]